MGTGAEQPLRVAIVEDHPLVIEALERRLIEAGMSVLPPSTAVESLDLSEAPDVVLCDLSLEQGKLQAGAAVAALVAEGLRVLAMSGVAVKAEVLDAIASGAAGFVEKTAPPSQFVEAVVDVAGGNLHVSPRLALYLLDDADKRPLSRGEISAKERGVLRALVTGDTLQDYAEENNVEVTDLQQRLTRVFDAARRRRRVLMPAPREAELLVLLGCEGLSHKAAAARMGVKVSVIPDFQKDIKAKYLATHPDTDESIAPRTVAQLWARELGLC